MKPCTSWTLAAILGAALLVTGCGRSAPTPTPETSATTTASPRALSELPTDRCAVCNAEFGGYVPVEIEYADGKVRCCCSHCAATFRQSPAKFVKADPADN